MLAASVSGNPKALRAGNPTDKTTIGLLQDLLRALGNKIHSSRADTAA
ncbi:hypothetical protein GCM10012280_69320 [Wenjunlia tyrosinilytica]|jgi:hypothetical protein|uniref:Uncharacterized protein n=1 Tax=Wenjunlia tyrosinilytica TaxID=1544741 RepID=A0A917ZYK5_9ACTN|nr:hypothetical protein GCM10012280_69320 [Wenjunlia tyrosinilytica]